MPEDLNRAQGRSIWSGSISFGLVTVPVQLFSATRRQPVSLRMLGPDGTPLARQYICPKDGEVLSQDDIERGYETSNGKFVIVTDEELEELAPRRSRDIALERFVPREQIDPAYFVRSYFLVPDADQTKAYRLLAETMSASGRAALGSFVMRDKAYAVAIFADEGILRAETLRFADEVRSSEDLNLPKPKVVKKKVQQMVKLVKSLSETRLKESELRDESTAQLLELARRKHSKGKDVVEAPEEAGIEEPDGVNVIDLMALLKARMRGRSSSNGASSGSSASPARKKRATRAASASGRSTRKKATATRARRKAASTGRTSRKTASSGRSTQKSASAARTTRKLESTARSTRKKSAGSPTRKKASARGSARKVVSGGR